MLGEVECSSYGIIGRLTDGGRERLVAIYPSFWIKSSFHQAHLVLLMHYQCCICALPLRHVVYRLLHHAQARMTCSENVIETVMRNIMDSASSMCYAKCQMLLLIPSKGAVRFGNMLE